MAFETNMPVTGNSKHEIAFIDTSISGYQTLLAGVREGVEVVLIDGLRDGMAEIAAALAGRSVDAVHLFSHGAPGALQLGTAVLTEQTMALYAAELSALRAALSDQGELLLYGCDVGQGVKGRAFIEALSAATGAAVAASDDPSGSALLGGDWELEVTTGVAGSSHAPASAPLSFSGLLAIGSENFDGVGQLFDTAQTFVVGNWTFTASTEVDVVTATAGEIAAQLNSDGGAGDRALLMNFSQQPGVQNYTMKSTDGTNFKLVSFQIEQALSASSNLTITAYSGNVAVLVAESVNLNASDSSGNIGYTLGGNSGSRYGTLTFNAAYANIDEIRFAFGGDSELFIDNINVTTAAPDSTAPVFSSAAVSGTMLVMSYTEASGLDSNNPPAASAFAVTAAGSSVAVSAVAVNTAANTVTLTLASPVAQGQAVTVAYTDPTAGNDSGAIQDLVGNDAASLGVTPVTNNTPDTTSPVFSSAAVNGSTLVMSFTDASTLNAANTAAAGAFTVTAGGSAVGVSAVTVDANAKTVTLTLAAPVAHGQAITVAYSDPSVGNDANAIQDAAGNDAASLPATSVTNNTPDATGPAVTSVAVPSGASYAAGQTLSFTVNFGEDITVAGTDSELALTIGATARAAQYASKSASSVTYTYTVQAGDNDADGVNVGALALGSSTIRDANGNDATLTLNGVGSTSAVLVDTAAPAVSGNISVPSNGSYSAGQTLSFTVTLDENVTITGSDSTLGLTIGATARNADQASKTATSITYEYTVQAGESDTDGITVGSIALGTTTVRDAAGNAADLTLTGHLPVTTAVLVDTTAPALSGTISAPADGTYAVGDALSFTVNFGEDITLAGSPSTLGLAVGANARSASVSGSTANSITYTYTVQNGDNDGDGIAVTGIALNGGTIRDSAGNNASLSLAGHLPALTGVLVDGGPPSVSGNISVPGDGAYRAGQVLSFTVTFDEDVVVSGTDSVLGLTIGSTARDAAFAAKTANSITYSYTVQAGEIDANGIAVGAITLGATTVKDAVGNDAVLTLGGHLPSTAGVLVDASAPAVTSVAVPSGATYVAGQNLDFTVSFGENVTLTGSDSTLGLTIGAAARSAGLLSGSGASATYRYTVQAGDVDADGITVGALALNGDTIRDAAGNDAVLTLNSVGATTGVLVDGTVPSVSGTLAVPGNDTYVAGETLSFTVNFNENVTVTGTDSALALTIGSTVRSAQFASSTANSITYAYTVQAGDNDADGIAVGAIALGSSTVRDAAGNNASLALAGHVPALTGVRVDTAAPTLLAATVNGATMVLTYSDASELDAANVPAASAFGVLVAGSPVLVNAVAVNAAARTFTLTLASAVGNGQAVSVAYADPTAGNDVNAIQDVLGNDAASLAPASAVNNTPSPAAPPAGATVDGVPVQTGTIVNPDGSTSQVITVPIVTPSRVDQVGNNAVADIPLVKDAGGTSLLMVQVPVGVGLQASGSATAKPAGSSLADLVREIEARTTAGSPDQNQLTGGGSGFIGGLSSDTPLLVHTIVVSGNGGSSASPVGIVAQPQGSGAVQSALVIDTRGLPNGAVLELQDVAFAAVIGTATVTGGAGAQYVWGDGASQNIFLGAGDDVLHGGAGDDIVGSAGGNDAIYGDAGNDLVFGGEGDDRLDGGAGQDIARFSGRSDSYSLRVVDARLVIAAQAGSDGTDTVAAVETLRFTGGQSGATDAVLARLYEGLLHRSASAAEVAYWQDVHERGVSMHDVTAAILGSAESGLLGNPGGASSNGGFVAGLYQNVLGRAASAQESSYWTTLLDGGTDRASVALGVVNSAEKLSATLDIDFNHSDVAVLLRMYHAMFGRAPDEAGLNYWLGTHERGATFGAIADAFVLSAEAQGLQPQGSNAAFIDQLYQTALERAPSAGEKALWLEQLQQGVFDRGQVLLNVAESGENIAIVGSVTTSLSLM